jgi:hypothetical protein
MIVLPAMEKRLLRLEQLARGPGVELSRWKGEDTPLQAGEKRVYPGGITDAIAGLDAARVALEMAVKRERAEGPAASRPAPGCIFTPT